MILILALAYLLLCGIGLLALQREHPSARSSSSKNDCSVFTIGRVMNGRLHYSLTEILQAVARSIAAAAGNWG